MGLLSNIDFLDHFSVHYRSTSVLFSLLQFVPTTKEIKAFEFNAIQCNSDLTTLKQRVRIEGTV